MGVGTVVKGIVKLGMCHVGDNVILQTSFGDFKTVILGIDIDRRLRKPNDFAYRGECVGINLRGVDINKINKGDKLILSR